MFDDLQKTQLAWVLHWILLAAVVALVPWLIYAVVAARYPAPVALAEVALLVSAVLSLVLVRAGRVRFVAVAFTVLFWVVIGVTAVFSGGVRGQALSGYSLVVLTAGFFLGGRSAVWTAIGSIAAAGTLFWAQSNGFLPSSPFGDGHMLASAATVIGGTAVFAHLLWLVDRQRADADRRLRMALQAADTGTFEWNVARGELTWSSNVAGMLQRRRESFGGRYARYLDQVHPEDRERFAAEFRRIPEASGPIELEYRTVRSDGEERWFQARGEVVERRDGAPQVIAGTITDVTRSRGMEHALRRQVTRNRQIVESMLDGYVLVTPEGRIVDANPSVCEMLGYTEAELRALAVWDVDVTMDRQTIVARLADWFEAGEKERFETRCRRKDGSVIDVEMTAVTVDTGDGLRLSGFLRDVTERKRWETALRESEERYRTLFENSLVGIGVVDEAGNFVEFNDAILRPGGYTREDIQAMGNVAALYYDPADRDDILAKLAAEGVLRREETRFRRKDGSAYDASLSVSPVTIGGRPHALAIVEDITELKRAEVALRQSEARHRAIVEDQTEFIVRWLPDGTRTFVNRAYAEHFRRPADELVGTSFFPLVGEEDRARIHRKIGDLTPERPAVTDEHRVIRPDGSIGWHQWTDRGIFDEAGRLLELQSVGRDVTERRRAESLMRESEQRYRSLFADSRDAVYVTTVEGAFVEVNDAMLRLFGYDRRELTQISAANLYVDRGRRAEFQSLIARQGSVRDFPVRLRRKSGEVLQCLLTSTARLAADGTVVGYQGVVRDVSEQRRAEAALKASEERYRALVELSPDAIAVHKDGVVVFANEAAADLVGAPTQEALIGMQVMDFVVPEDRAIVGQRMLEMATSGTTAPPLEETFVRLDGSSVPVEVRAVPVELEGDHAVQVVVRDISARKRADAEVRASQERMTRAFSLSPDVITITELESGRLVEVNDRFSRFSGWSREEALGRTTLELGIWGAARERGDWVERLQRDGRADAVEMVLYDRWGDAHATLVSAAVLELGGMPHLLSYVTDVTDQKRQEQALRDSEERLRQALTAAKAGAWRWEISDDRVQWSEENFRLLGLDPHSTEPSYDRWLERVHPDDRARVQLEVQKAVETRHALDAVYRVVQPDGSMRWINDVGELRLTESGEPAAMFGIQIDITDRKNAEEARSAALEEQRMILSQIDEIVYSVELAGDRAMTGGPHFVSDRVSQILGYAPTDFYERPQLWFEAIHPDDEGDVRRSTDEVIRQNVPATREYRLRHKTTGKYRWMEDRVVPRLDDAGRVIGLSGVARDVTGRRAAEEALRMSEERHRRLFETMAQGVVYQDRDGQIMGANPAAEHILGRTLDEMRGRDSKDPRWRAIREDGTQFLGDEHPSMVALRTGSEVHGVVMGVFHPGEGRHRWIMIDAVPEFEPGADAPRRVYTTFTDITDRKDAEAQLLASREQLRWLAARTQAVREEERTAIAREIHDELGQGLTGIKMDVAWLLGRLPRTWKRVRERGDALIDLLDATIDAVRDLSSRLRPSVLDDLGVAAAVEWQTAEFARRTGIQVELAEVQELPLDRERGTALFRILQEALTNVARHASASRVRVSLRRSDGDVVLEVVDDGRGLTTAEVDDPMALGLLGMRERAVVLGGEVRFGQNPAGGTHVTASMPLGTPEG